MVSRDITYNVIELYVYVHKLDTVDSKREPVASVVLIREKT